MTNRNREGTMSEVRGTNDPWERCFDWTIRVLAVFCIGLPVILVGWVLGIVWLGLKGGFRLAEDTVDWVCNKT